MLGKSDTNKQIAVFGSERSLVTGAESPRDKGTIANDIRVETFQFCDLKKKIP